ncbi:hypothetical protein [Rhizobium leguminosarum]|uniref:hypothetical protein n=1 Tax=Rhizobium leguminosarum TaxID=384 RepID=UPI00102F3632|nr:hypothetical protein [Rhizobium leguminosarum]TAW50614.1 hypothetical protein ELI14_04160 [Rhizobium leguminosarum]
MNQHLMTLTRGGQYPYRVATREGASAQFLMHGHDFLQVCMPNITKTEEARIIKGGLKAGLIQDGPLILLLFQFGDELIFECPFDARLIAPDRRNLPNLTNDRQRFFFDIHLVDTATNKIRGFRGITLPTGLTVKFFAAVQDQLVDRRGQDAFIRKYQQTPLPSLAQLAKLEICGL